MATEEKPKKATKGKRGLGKLIKAEPAKVPSGPVAEVSLPKEAFVKVSQPKSKKAAVTKVAKPVVEESVSHKEPVAKLTFEQIQLRAYFIAERRKSLGIGGNETSDWVQAERELLNELGGE